MALIKIIPSPLSRRFDNIDGIISQYEENTLENGTKESKSIGEYKRHRFPLSTQGERPISYSTSKKKYILKDHPNNSEELNELVKKCNLINDIKGHYDYNRPIVGCDIYNTKDPFFNHKSLKINLDEGIGTLNTDYPLDYLIYQGVLQNNRFQVGGETSNPALNGRAKYIIVDASIDRDAKKQARNTRKTAEKLIEAMSDDKKRSVALAMGLIVQEDTDVEIITELLEEAAVDSKASVSLTMSKQRLLIKLAEAPNEELAARNYVNNAFKKGLIKKDKETSSYVLFGVQIGKDKQTVINYLINPVNSDTLHRLQKAIDLND